MAEITDILNRPATNARSRWQRTAPVVHRELRRTAGKVLRQSECLVGPQTLQPDELLAEFYLRLLRDDSLRWASRNHFYAYAAAAMRTILIDRYRARTAEKRSAALTVPLSHANATANPASERIEITILLHRLRALSERQARIVEMHVFGGFSFEEIAGPLGVSAKTVQRDWVAARAWLYAELRQIT